MCKSPATAGSKRCEGSAADEKADTESPDLDATLVKYLLDSVTRHAWRLEEAQPDLFGAFAFESLDETGAHRAG